MIKLLLLCIAPLLVISQHGDTNWYHYDWKKNGLPDKLEYYTRTLKEDYAKYKNSEYLGMYDRHFISNCALGLYQSIEYGSIYESLEGYEHYVRRVLETTVGDLELCKQIQIVFVRNVDFNASMSENGLLKLNIGLFQHLRNEAELALILAHEIGHHLNNDVVKNYGRYMTVRYHSGGSGVFGIINGFKSANDYYAFSRDIETMADHTALRFMDESGYDFKLALRAYKTMEDLQTRYQLKEGKIRKYWRTHPYAAERRDYLTQQASLRNKNGQKRFLVDSLAFHRLKTICFQQCVNVCLMDHSLNELVTMGFSRYLLEPNDPYHLAILLEGLRRKLADPVNPRVGDEPFILNDYLGPLRYKFVDFAYLNRPNVSILHCLDRGLLDIRPEELSHIKALELKDTSLIEFRSNLEAYQYFKELANAQGNILATHARFFGREPDFSNSEAFVAANNLFKSNDLIKDRGHVALVDTSLIALLPLWTSFSSDPAHDYELQEYLQLNQGLKEDVSLEQKIKAPCLLSTELEPDDQSTLYGLIHVIHEPLEKSPAIIGVRSSNLNWLSMYPEAFAIFKKRGIHSIFICSVEKKNEKHLSISLYKVSLPGYAKYSLQLKELQLPLRYRAALYPDFKATGVLLKNFIKYDAR